MDKEVWKDIPEYEGLYQVSNLGVIRSVDRVVVDKNGVRYNRKGVVLKAGKNNSGYFSVNLHKGGKLNSQCVHKIVLLAFVGKSDLQGDHINEIKSDNRLANLEYVTHRDNVCRHRASRKYSSKYLGVLWDKSRSKWLAQISIKGKKKYLGRFTSETQAAQAYIEAVNNLTN